MKSLFSLEESRKVLGLVSVSGIERLLNSARIQIPYLISLVKVKRMNEFFPFLFLLICLSFSNLCVH